MLTHLLRLPPSPFDTLSSPDALRIRVATTILWNCGVLKLLFSCLAISFAGILFICTMYLSIKAHDDPGWRFISSLIARFGMSMAGTIVILTLLPFASGFLDTISGVYARKGKVIGQKLGILSSVFGLLVDAGCLAVVSFAPRNWVSQLLLQLATRQAITIYLFLGCVLNIYLLLSFVFYKDAFRY